MIDHAHLGQARWEVKWSHKGFMDSKVRGIKFVASQVRYKEIKEVEGSEAVVKDKGFSF